jgi:hypothetical protein
VPLFFPATTVMYTRVHGLWFEDGGLIIKAESTIFRISKCLLAARSTFFSDMIILPPLPESDMELIDGIPVVTLPDPAKDVEVFLRAIVDSRYIGIVSISLTSLIVFKLLYATTKACATF